MTDWLMVIITLVYVVATIKIGQYNHQTSKATLSMLEENKRQFEEENRPHIAVELIFQKRAFYSLRFTNQGKRCATNVRIKFEQSFIDSISDQNIRSLLDGQKGRECIIGVGQYYDLYICNSRNNKKDSIMPIIGTVVYQSGKRQFEDAFSVDIANYMTIFSVNSEIEDLTKAIDNQKKELERIGNSLNEIYMSLMGNSKN